MSFLKNLFGNVLKGGHGSNAGYSKHGGNKHGYSSYQAEPTTQGNNNCSKCGSANTNQARFCQQCGGSLIPTNCSKCNQVVAMGAKFCGNCGAAQ